MNRYFKALQCHCPKLFMGVLLGALACAFFVGPAEAAKRQVTKAEYDLFTKAKKQLKQGKFAKAEAALEKYFRQTKRPNEFGYELYGFILLRQDKGAKAVPIMEKGAREYPKNLSIVQNYGAALARQKRYGKAAAAYLKAYELSGRKRNGLAFSAALFLFRDKQYAQSEAVMLRLMGKGKVRPPWFVLLAQAQIYQEKMGKAEAVLDQAVAAFPNRGRLWRLMAFVYFKQGKKEEAAAAYEVAYRLKPPTSREAEQLATLYASLGAPHMSAHKLEEKGTTPRMLDALAFGQARSGNLEAALNKAEQAYKNEPTSERLFRKAIILLRMDRQDQARKCLEEVGNSSGKWKGRAYWALAMMSWSEGDWERTASLLRKVMQVDKKFARKAKHMLRMVEMVSTKEAGTVSGL